MWKVEEAFFYYIKGNKLKTIHSFQYFKPESLPIEFRMDLLGDIVEKEVDAPVELTSQHPSQSTGFPKPKKSSSWSTKRSKFKQKQESKEGEKPVRTSKDGFALDESTGLKRLPKEDQKLNYEHLSEAEKIHLENIEILNNMSEKDRLREKQELFDSFDPKVLKALLLRSEKKLQKNHTKSTTDDVSQFQGYGEWIGGDKKGNDYEAWKANTLDKTEVDAALGFKEAGGVDLARDLQEDQSNGRKKSVRFDVDDAASVVQPEESKTEEVDPGWEDEDEIAPASYQINKDADEVPIEEAIANVHFTKPQPIDSDELKLDINDPDFNDKLHEKYFPDLPRDTEKLKWMEQLPELDTSDLIFDDVSQLRFDFHGDLMIPSKNNQINTSDGLHHHSENPALAGYTLSELAHLSRSSMPGQRCIAIQTLGRILHKLGKGKYNIVPEFVPDEDEDDNEAGMAQEVQQPDEEALKQAATKFDQMFWGVIDELRIIETLEECADEALTRNMSVRNYAIEALWLWKQGGGNKRHAN